MLRLAAGLVVLISLAGASLAQDGVPQEQVVDPAYRAEFENLPDGRTTARLLPPRMLDRGVSGVAHLCCAARADRTLDCRVAFEWPQRERLGETALRMVERTRLTPQSFEAYQAQPGRMAHLPIEVRREPLPAETSSAFETIAGRTQNLCGDLNRPSEPIVISISRR